MPTWWVRAGFTLRQSRVPYAGGACPRDAETFCVQYGAPLDGATVACGVFPSEQHRPIGLRWDRSAVMLPMQRDAGLETDPNADGLSFDATL